MEKNSQDLPVLKKKRHLFKSLERSSDKLLNSSQLSSLKPASLSPNRAELKTKLFLSTPKIKQFKIPDLKTHQNELKKPLKKKVISRDGYLIHQFSIPSSLIIPKQTSPSSKSLPSLSFILNPNMRIERIGLKGQKLSPIKSKNKKINF